MASPFLQRIQSTIPSFSSVMCPFFPKYSMSSRYNCVYFELLPKATEPEVQRGRRIAAFPSDKNELTLLWQSQ